MSSNSPTFTHSSLAVYDTGVGEPLMLMPYPHGFGLAPIARGPLAEALSEPNRRVISFDPPGAFHTTRRPDMSMSEMLNCANEVLATAQLQQPITLVGHSMGGFCAIAFALNYPARVKRLILIGTLSGASAIQRNGGMPFGRWLSVFDRFRYTTWGLRVGWGIGATMAIHKQMLRIIVKTSYVDQQYVPPVEISPEDHHCPAPIRDTWSRTLFTQRLDYRARLGEIHAPTLICAGRYDPQAPVGCSQELAAGIPQSRLILFDHSGHYPFTEERALFQQAANEFLSEP